MYRGVARREKPASAARLSILLALLFAGFAPAVAADAADRVNAVRLQAGLVPLAGQPLLAEAARRHAEYLAANVGAELPRHGLSAHAQLKHRPGFSGATPKERAVNAGYPHQRVIENVTIGYRDAGDAVDGLMGAIYHRLAFLDLTVDEIGAAGRGEAHVFLMGRSDLRGMCRSPGEEVRVRTPVDCLGTKVEQGYIERLCAALPAAAEFRSPWPEACPNGVRLNAEYMTRFCRRPPAAALADGGRYYALCDGQQRIRADWLEDFCAAPPAEAVYAHGGAYYQICEPPVAVYAEWLEEACAGAGAQDRYRDSGRYELACAERPLEVRVEHLSTLTRRQQKRAPRYVRWPPDRADDMPPAFFEEAPDPLPDRAVSGYPVSIQFNPARTGKVEVSDFALFENVAGEWRRLSETRLLDAASDPNRQLSELEFALFPLRRLTWGREYLAVLVARIDGRAEQIEWSFTTRRPADRLIELSDADQTLLIAADRATALYLPPTPARPHTVTSLTSHHGADTQVKLWAIDPNTLGVRLGGGCGPVYLRLRDGPELKLLREGCTAVKPRSGG